MITEKQLNLINSLIKVGYGWGKFAQSVLDSGNCSEKQFECMMRMRDKILSKQNSSKPMRVIKEQSPEEKLLLLKERREREAFDNSMREVLGTDYDPNGFSTY